MGLVTGIVLGACVGLLAGVVLAVARGQSKDVGGRT